MEKTLDENLRTHPFWRDYLSYVRTRGLKRTDEELYEGFRGYLHGVIMGQVSKNTNVRTVRDWFEDLIAKEQAERFHAAAVNHYGSLP